MQNRLFRKSLVIGIIILFVGASVGPSISGNVSKKENLAVVKETNDYIDIENTAGQGIFLDDPPETEWTKTFGGTGLDWGFSVQQTTDEGYIITGIKDTDWRITIGDVWLIKVEPEYINHPPSPPTIDGPKNGKVGIEYEYTFNSTDDDGDDVRYFVNWGDGSPIEIVIPTPQNPDNGNEAKASHKWDKRGRYGIRARTEDANGALSPWSDPFTVTMPRNRAININSLFYQFLEQFPILRLLLQR